MRVQKAACLNRRLPFTYQIESNENKFINQYLSFAITF